MTKGGFSIKPSGGMEEMKYDMGGSAVVLGLMKALALRKTKANVSGVIGLVENMPSGTAQRPGDVVKSMSGQTIEVINTDVYEYINEPFQLNSEISSPIYINKGDSLLEVDTHFIKVYNKANLVIFYQHAKATCACYYHTKQEFFLIN